MGVLIGVLATIASILLLVNWFERGPKMGVYDTIRFPCPICGEMYHAQSKGSSLKSLREFNLVNTPKDVLSDVNRHAPFECPKCFTTFKICIYPTVCVIKVGRTEKEEGS